MTENEFHIAMDQIESYVAWNTKALHEVTRWHKALQQKYRNNELVQQLYALSGWHNFNMAVLSEMANDTDALFIKLMLKLANNHFSYNVISMHRWWRRLKAINGEHVITYLHYPDLVRDALNANPPKYVTWQMIVNNCTANKFVLQQLLEAYGSDTTLDLAVREKLGGISLATDVPTAWRAWAKEHHPDKGGNLEEFVRVKTAYEEWVAVFGPNKA